MSRMVFCKKYKKEMEGLDAALQGEMDKYFSGDDYDKAEGYVPPAQ